MRRQRRMAARRRRPGSGTVAALVREARAPLRMIDLRRRLDGLRQLGDLANTIR